MNILDAIPGIGKILDDVISTPEEKREAQIRLRELDIREIEAKSHVQASWMSNQSLFVAGAIPSMLWMVVLVVFFNYIIAPIVQSAFGVTIPILDLPQWYSEMCGTIILGLFAKKAWDNTDMSWGKMTKHSVWKEDQMEHPLQPSSFPVAPQPVATPIQSAPAPAPAPYYVEDDEEVVLAPVQQQHIAPNTKNKKNQSNLSSIPAVEQQQKPDYNDPNYINQRLAELSAEIDKKHKNQQASS